MPNKILVTSALPYANGPIHLGHLAGAYLPADLYVRFKRLQGREIIHICGSDEHGVAITLAAKKQGISPEEVVEEFHDKNARAFEQFGISFDYFGRTSSNTHKEVSQDFFRHLDSKDVFVQKSEEQLYDAQAEMFLPDRYVKGTCPNCGYEEAYGDQCEKCGTSLSPTELINPVSALTNEIPVRKETKHWYLPLGDFQEFLEQWIGSKADWKSNVTGQCKSWLQDGLKDRAVTRDLNWGVPVPHPDADGKVLYVWFDAPIGYISATKEWAAEQNKPELWKKYWQDEDTELIHFIGKDNIVFHCIMFPAMLKAHGDYVLPKNVPANEFLNLEGRKLSTSRGWAVWLEEYLESFEPDLLRYVLGTILPESKDSDFSWSDFQAKVNNELADVLGNFINRSLIFADKYFNSSVPELIEPTEKDEAMLDAIGQFRSTIADSYDRFRFREAIASTMELAREGNRFFTEMEPWKTRKENPVVCGNTIHICLQLSAALSMLFEPIMPNKSKDLRGFLGISNQFGWDDINGKILQAGNPIIKGDILFEKIEDETIEAEIAKLKARSESQTSGANEAPSYEPLKETITFDDFMKLDLRAAKVTHAEKVPKSNKLLKLTVDIGFETRTVLSGIAKFLSPEEVTGKTLCLVANLKPRKMMGVESQGMILMSETTDGDLLPVETDAEPGSTIS